MPVLSLPLVNFSGMNYSWLLHLVPSRALSANKLFDRNGTHLHTIINRCTNEMNGQNVIFACHSHSNHLSPICARQCNSFVLYILVQKIPVLILYSDLPLMNHRYYDSCVSSNLNAARHPHSWWYSQAPLWLPLLAFIRQPRHVLTDTPHPTAFAVPTCAALRDLTNEPTAGKLQEPDYGEWAIWD